MSLLHLSPQQARHLQLAAQGLLNPPRRKAGKADVLAAIRRMALLQIDTIHVRSGAQPLSSAAQPAGILRPRLAGRIARRRPFI
ncbi:hypothetical protein JOS77_12065 [Chromobacterium haemolyticum]|nr:hypothetical protein JOS77_12065 [Chromobacterium haemolyticum]